MLGKELMKIYRQASAIPYRIKKEKLQILILTSRNKKNWIVPKGLVDEGETEIITALKETIEEAGVKGEVIEKIAGSYTYKKWNGVCQVNVYPLEVNEVYKTWEEMDFRIRKWADPAEAVKRVKPRKLSKILEKFIIELEVK